MMQIVVFLACMLLALSPSQPLTQELQGPVAQIVPGAGPSEVERPEPMERPRIGSSKEGFNAASEAGEYTIYVPGKSTVGPGPAYIVWQFNLLKGNHSGQGFYRSKFLADVQPVAEEMAVFQEDFGGVSAYIAERAGEMFGDFLQEISFQTISIPEGAAIYLMRVALSDGSNPMEFTASWRFEQSYAASYLGVNLGDMPDMDLLVLAAAEAFEDHTAAPGTAAPKTASKGTFSYDPGPWDLPVKNVLGLIGECAPHYLSFRIEPRADEAAIRWQHDYMEAVARKVAGKPEGPIFPSDLEHIVRIDFAASKTQPDAYTFNAYGPYERAATDDASHTFSANIPVRNLAGLEYFRGVKILTLSLHDVLDVAALEALDRVERASLVFSPEITDLSPMGGMRSLRYLMMWGYDYPLVKDISFLEALTNLETVFFMNSSLSDAGVFTRLPALTQLYLNAADTLDVQPLIDCAHIEELMLNGTTVR